MTRKCVGKSWKIHKEPQQIKSLLHKKNDKNMDECHFSTNIQKPTWYTINWKGFISLTFKSNSRPRTVLAPSLSHIMVNSVGYSTISNVFGNLERLFNMTNDCSLIKRLWNTKKKKKKRKKRRRWRRWRHWRRRELEMIIKMLFSSLHLVSIV